MIVCFVMKCQSLRRWNRIGRRDGCCGWGCCGFRIGLIFFISSRKRLDCYWIGFMIVLCLSTCWRRHRSLCNWEEGPLVYRFRKMSLPWIMLSFQTFHSSYLALFWWQNCWRKDGRMWSLQNQLNFQNWVTYSVELRLSDLRDSLPLTLFDFERQIGLLAMCWNLKLLGQVSKVFVLFFLLQNSLRFL